MYPCLYTALINLEFLKMNKLTRLHSECLANMPMILDVMTNTIEALSELLEPQYEQIEKYLMEFFDTHKKLRCQLDESWERGTVYAFRDHETRLKKGCLLELYPILELYNCLNFRKAGTNGALFSVEFGYTSNGEYNVIYFGLKEKDSTKYLTNNWIDSVQTSEWESWTDSGYIELQIEFNDQLTDEKIARCGKDFRNHLLKPLLEQLQ